MKAIQLNCTDAYGAMLWDLSSDHTESFCKAWNIQARHCWNVDRATHVYLVENYFCSDLVSLRNQIYSRYCNFVKKLKESPSREVKLLFTVLSKDARSPTNRNIHFLNQIVKVDVVETPKIELKPLFPKALGQQNDSWRLRLLDLFLEARKNVEYRSSLNLSATYVKAMIDSLCIS